MLNTYDFTTRIGKESRLKGILRFKNSLIIEGKLEGEIYAGEFLYIAQESEIKAFIQAQTVVIAGIVIGDIEASGIVELQVSSRVYGNIVAKKVRIAEGAIFEGNCNMVENQSMIDNIFTVSLDELRHAIQNDIDVIN